MDNHPSWSKKGSLVRGNRLGRVIRQSCSIISIRSKQKMSIGPAVIQSAISDEEELVPVEPARQADEQGL